MKPFSSSPSSSSVVLLLLVALNINNCNVEAFSPRLSGIQSASAAVHASSYMTMYASKDSSSSSKPRPSFLEQMAGETNAAYFKRLSQTASDPIAFEKMVLGELNKDASPSLAEATKEVAQTTSMKDDKNTDSNSKTEVNDKKKQRGYQRAEDWEADQAKELKKMSWEERVQYDGQQNGNKFKQNEILRKNLHGF